MVRIPRKKIAAVLLSLFLSLSAFGAGKAPYKPLWATSVKKGKFFKYKRKEFASPGIYQDRIFVGSDGGFFQAMNKEKGSKLWRFKTEGAVNSAPAFWDGGGGRVFIGDDEGVLYALSVSEGKEIWRARFDSEILTPPAVRGNKLFVAAMGGQVAAVNADDGHILWNKEHPLEGFRMTIHGNSPVILNDGGERLFVGFADGTLWALSTDGKLIWEKTFEQGKKGFSDIDGAPLVDGERLYVATFDGGLFALAKNSGQTVWSREIGSGVRLAADGERLYLSGSDGRLYALHKKDGTKIWDLKVGEGALTAPLVYHDLVAVGLSEEGISFIQADEGRLVGKRFAKKGIFSDPIVEGDQIYYLSNGGRLYSLRFVR